MTAGVQVAGPGGFQELKQGQLNILPTGTYFGNVPVVIDSKTGQIVSATGSAQDLETLRAGNVSTLRVDTSKINPAFLDKSPLNPNISQDELNALKGVAKADAARNALKTGKFDEYFNTYGGSPAGDPVYKQMLEEALANDPTNQNFLDEYKKISGQDYTPSTTSTATTPVTDLGTVEIVGKKETPTIYSGPTTGATTGVSPTTPSVDTKPTDTTTTSTTPSTTPSTTTTSITSSVYSGGVPGSDSSGGGGGVGGGGGGDVITSSPSGGDKNVVTKPFTVLQPDIYEPRPDVNIFGQDALQVTNEPPKPTEEQPSFTTKPYIYSGVSPKGITKSLYPTLSSLGTSPLEQSLAAYRPPGEVEGEATGKPRQNVWNEASLRLKDALGI
jgi:hypothetical protein